MTERAAKFGERDLLRVLHPEELKQNLLGVSLFVLAYEMFRSRVTNHPKTLYSTGWDEKGIKLDTEEYRANVLSRHKSPFQAALLWFESLEAIDETDLAALDRLRQFRNQVVHELVDTIAAERITEVHSAFDELVRLFRKIEVWWIEYFELPCNPEFDGVEVSADEIVPGPVIMLRMLNDIAFGSEKDAWQYFNEAMRQRGSDGANDSA